MSQRVTDRPMMAAPFRDDTGVHVVFSTKKRPDRRGFVLCGRPVAPMQRLATTNRAVPTTCERCTRSLTALVELWGEA